MAGTELAGMGGRNFGINVALNVQGALMAADQLINKQRQLAQIVQDTARTQEATFIRTARVQEQATTQAVQRSSQAMSVAQAMIAQRVLQMGRDVLGSGSQGLAAGREIGQERGAQFFSMSESLRQVANLKGTQVTPQFMRQFAEGNLKTLMTPQESVQFQESFLGAGAEWIGNKPDSRMRPDIAQRFSDQAALYAVSRQGDPKVFGEMAGRIIGSKNRVGMGAAGPADAMKTLARVMATIDIGVGDQNQMAQQVTQLMAAGYREDGTGAFKTPEEAAQTGSILAEKNPGHAFTGGMAAVKALSEYSNPLVMKAGITPQQNLSLKQKIEMLAPVVEAERKKRGNISVFDLLNRTGFNKTGLPDDLGVEGVSTLLEFGVNKGLYGQREEYAEEQTKDNQFYKNMGAYMMTPGGMNRTSDAKNERDKAFAAERSMNLFLLRKEAARELTAEGNLNTSAAAAQEALGSVMSMGMLPSKAKEDIDLRVAANLNRRLPRGARPLNFKALDLNAPIGSEIGSVTDEARRDDINRMVAKYGEGIMRDPADRSATDAMVSSWLTEARRIPGSIASEPPVNLPLK